MKLHVCVFTIAALAAGCLLPPKMRDTTLPAGSSAWDTIVANAQKAGYTTQRSDSGSHDGKYFWFVKATKASGTIYYTKNNGTGQVAFTCQDVEDCSNRGMALINGQ